ncbi:hypothetical protein LU687_011250 [Pseudomonas asiatica]|uniref:hypothetical protein n=1 Tax=Pseudomonas asiatica TaxID=2219225 RepID=UPI001E2A46A0|nr:hypothetical protein [Pseudomonas asiatica]WJR24923.1 hypothetical protein LU687_011250 [Pseudomonas asiatica]
MDIKTLEALGVSATDLADRIVNQAVHTLLHSVGYDEDGEEFSRSSRFQQQIQQRVKEAIDQKIDAMFAEHVLPRVGEIIESADMRKTSSFGEPKGEPMTFKEYIASRAEAYMSEKVNVSGQSKDESGDYNWRESGPRLTVLMRLYIKDTLEKSAKSAINDVNKVIAKNIEQAAKDAINSCAASLKVAAAI